VQGDLKYLKPENSAGSYSNVEPQELVDIVNKWQTKLSEFK
jgi:5-methylthioadenosine/S-adenosylhomocysteine deaminase